MVEKLSQGTCETRTKGNKAGKERTGKRAMKALSYCQKEKNTQNSFYDIRKTNL